VLCVCGCVRVVNVCVLVCVVFSVGAFVFLCVFGFCGVCVVCFVCVACVCVCCSVVLCVVLVVCV